MTSEQSFHLLERSWTSISRRTIEVLSALRNVEERTIDMAHRARQLASLIFRYAIATGRAERDPTADLKGALKIKKVKHHAAITDPAGVGVYDGF